ncbi:MAG: AbrB/MazE/SpoVT family DNA-binding domain-containing protein [Nitrosopumilus sp.]|nr:AbrB/MazE/SpoVT family DNA-binding domain-containing protein [Nitrosopumilus sp.]MCE2507049.1 AbrB/MazE/SpoVT family DNA-binding domain-containing protein [Nitrosopumilaceae archaeon]
MAKIQRVKAYTYKDRNVYKFRINIPADVLKDLGWKEGTEVEFKTKNKKLEISKM